MLDREEERFRTLVGTKEKRSLKARNQRRINAWFGLGMFGVIGWSVMIPTVLGIAMGIWLDSRYDDSILWTLMLALIGLMLGCLNAWYWISEQRRHIEEEQNRE